MLQDGWMWTADYLCIWGRGGERGTISVSLRVTSHKKHCTSYK